MFKRIVSGGGWSLAGKLVFALATLAINAVLARLFVDSPEAVGAYYLAFNIAFFGSIVGMMGLNQSMVRFIAESKQLQHYSSMGRAIRTAAILSVISAAVVFGLYMAFQHYLNESLFHSPMLEQASLLVGLWIVVYMFQQLLAESFRGFGDIKYATLFGGLFSNLFILAGLLVLSWAGSVTLSDVFLLTLTAILLNVLISAWVFVRMVRQFKEEHRNVPPAGEPSGSRSMREVLLISAPMMVSAIMAFLLTSSDLWILGAFEGAEEVAVYGVVTRLIALFALCEVVVTAVLPSVIVSMHTDGETRKLERVCRIVTTLSCIPAIVIFIGFLVLGTFALGIFGTLYQSGYWLLIVLSVGRLVSVGGSANGLLLTLTGNQVTMMRIAMTASVITVAGGILCASWYGAMGLAAAMSGGLLLYNVMLWVLTKRKLGIFVYPNFLLLLEEGRQLLQNRRSAGLQQKES